MIIVGCNKTKYYDFQAIWRKSNEGINAAI